MPATTERRGLRLRKRTDNTMQMLILLLLAELGGIIDWPFEVE